ncbi:hypothetical protein CCACVL1_16008 [Corchorus capsularis]|uniref:Nuclear transport factor 2 n=1 Tax=Corchorus capsularis TaxID=210143 RepID=A0A1R3HZU8_COCAP|nr:hypothetical protein CCACVL1_16008 [Corchorus capsularis]
MDEPTAYEVAYVFVKTYYELLCVSPGEIHKFYKDSSTVTRPGHDGAMLSFTTMEEIKEHVASSMDCKGSEIHSFDSQYTSNNNGVVILVMGRLFMENDETRRFNQSFFLAPMENVYGYFVSNDVFRFLDEQETVIMRMGDVSTAISSPTQDDVSTKEALPKKTFLSVVNSLSENSDPFKEPPVKTESEKNGWWDRKRYTRHGDFDNATTVFVGNVARDSKPEELYEVFKDFGPIKNDGVHIRFDKQDRWFAFVRFESSTSAESAVKASPIRFGNRSLNVEEKKRNNENRNTNMEEKKWNNESGNRKFSQGSNNSNGQVNFRGSWNFNKSDDGPVN